MMTLRRIKLKDVVEDKITGFKGTVMAVTQYMYGCTQILVQPMEVKDCSYPKAVWLDEPQLKLVKSGGGDKSKPRYGGNRSHPK